MLARRALARAPVATSRANVSLALPIRSLVSQTPATALEAISVSAVANLLKAPHCSFSGRAFSTSLRLGAAAASKTTKRKKTTKAASKKKKPKKTAAKKKKPVKKAKKPKKPKKQLTEAQKKSQKVQELKKIALIAEEPKGAATTPFAYFTSERAGKGETIAVRARRLGQEWRSLSEGERQRYTQIAEQNAASVKRSVSAWVATKTPNQIRNANNARRLLKRIKKQPLPPGRTTNFIAKVPSPLADPRQPTRPKTAYILFVGERRASGDFSNIPVTQVSKQLASEWRNLSESEKAKYYDTHARNSEQYKEDFAAAFPERKASRAGQ